MYKLMKVNHLLILLLFVLCCLEFVEYPDGTITPAANVNANPPPPPPTAHSPVQRAPGRIADYDPLSEARPSPYSARQAATTVIYTSDKGAGKFRFAFQTIIVLIVHVINFSSFQRK